MLPPSFDCMGKSEKGGFHINLIVTSTTRNSQGVETCYSHMFTLSEAGKYSFSHKHMYNISNVKKR